MTKHLTRRQFLFGRTKDFSDDESGATAIEYGLIAVVTVFAIAVPLKRSGLWIERKFYCLQQTIMGWEIEAPCYKE